MFGIDVPALLGGLAGTFLFILLYEKVAGKSWWQVSSPHPTGPERPRHCRFRVIVLGCLRSGEMTVIIREASTGENRQLVIPAEIVPVELRMPNSSFDVLFDRRTRKFVRVLDAGELWPECDS